MHRAPIWGAVTPFAKEHDQPWLYGAVPVLSLAAVAVFGLMLAATLA